MPARLRLLFMEWTRHLSGMALQIDLNCSDLVAKPGSS